MTSGGAFIGRGIERAQLEAASPAPSAAPARSCCSAARPGSARRACARTPWRTAGAALRPRGRDPRLRPVRPRRRRPARLPAHAARRPRRRAARCARTSRCCCRSSATRAPTDDRATLFEAIRCGLEALVAHGPATILLDDLQWSDEATLELLAALAPDAAPTCRCSSSPPTAPTTSRAPIRCAACATTCVATARCTSSRSRPLGAARDRRSWSSRSSAAAPSPRLAATLHARTGGVPFFVEELTAALRASERLTRRPPTARSSRSTATSPLPQTIRDAVLVQAAPLSDAARAVAETAAAVGTSFDLDVVATVAGEDGLDELLAAGLIRETDAGPRGLPPPARPRGDLRRRAVAARRALHRRLAEALRARRRRPGQVATHWLAARDTSRALEALLEAIAAAAAVHAYRDAARLGRQALDAVARGRARPRAADRRRAVRRARRAGGRPRRGGARPARGRRGPPRERRGPRAGRRRAPDRRASTRCRATASGRSRRAASPPRPTPPTVCRARPRPSAWSMRGLPAERRPAHARRRRPRELAADEACAPTAPTCAPARWACTASPGSRAAPTRRASRSSAADCRSPSSTS